MSVFDLDAVLAEAQPREPFRFKFGGEDYELPASPDLRAFAALSAERLDDGFRMLLGPDQWDRLQASPAVFDNTAFEKLIVAYQAHVGDLGGIRGLCALLEEHGEAVEADLQQFYGVRLSDLGTSLSWRRLGVLVRQLPDTSRTFAAQHGETWSRTDQLLAAMFDVLNGANWQRGGGKGPRPKPLARPGVDDREVKRYGKPVRTIEELNRRLHPERYQ